MKITSEEGDHSSLLRLWSLIFLPAVRLTKEYGIKFKQTKIKTGNVHIV